jgi:hypothetical protein
VDFPQQVLIDVATGQKRADIRQQDFESPCLIFETADLNSAIRTCSIHGLLRSG